MVQSHADFWTWYTIGIPEGGPEDWPWPAGAVTVFFQSSRHIQVSVWSEAFAILIDSGHVQAFLQVDPRAPRRVSALHLIAMPMCETIFYAPMHAMLRLERAIVAFKEKAGRCTICCGDCLMMTFGPLLDWAPRYTRDYAGHSHTGINSGIRDESKLSGTLHSHATRHPSATASASC